MCICRYNYELVQAAADGDLEYIDKLLNQVIDFTSTNSMRTHDLVKVCAPDGWNMFHAAVMHKRIDIIIKLLEYGTGILIVI